MRARTLLQTLLSYLVVEHVCYPPDQDTTWILASRDEATRTDQDAYICPECGQHMVRSVNIKSAA
jgi:hypothetical protein